MAISNIKATFPCDIKKAWETVTSLDKYEWGSDLSKIFDMENSNMKGHWIGVFTPKGTQTEIDFTEDVTAKKIFMKPFVKGYLKSSRLSTLRT